jgi:formylmethanofuran dehydrogenase subunit C
MSVTHLKLHTQPDVPLETEVISPSTFANLSTSGIEHLNVMHGNVKCNLGDFFKVTGTGSNEIHIEGNLSGVKLIGAGMQEGKIIVDGDVGMHLGVGMSGGEIIVNGNAGDWVGPEMSGGRIVIKKNAGHMVGSAYRGQATGITGGEIFVHGDAKNEIGSAMRRGLIVIGGNAGDFTGVNMLAGTIIVLGELGIRTGAGMKRGSIVSLHDAAMLPSFEYSCTYHPLFLRLYFTRLRANGFSKKIQDQHLSGKYKRYSGDGIELNRGEVLLYSG